MTDPRHARVIDVFLQATELDGTRRAAYLDAACSDDETLRAEVVQVELGEAGVGKIYGVE